MSMKRKHTYLLLLCKLSKMTPGERAGSAAAFWSWLGRGKKHNDLFFYCDRILAGGLILIYQRNSGPSPFWASSLIKLPTDKSSNEGRGGYQLAPGVRKATLIKSSQGVDRTASRWMGAGKPLRGLMELMINVAAAHCSTGNWRWPSDD